MQIKITKLRRAETAFIEHLDSVNYSKESVPDERAAHYRLIEGFRNDKEVRASFVYDNNKGKAIIFIHSRFPKMVEELTTKQFYEWLEKPHRNYIQG